MSVLTTTSQESPSGAGLRVVRVTRVDPLGDRIVALELTDAAGDPLPDWEPGAHVDVVLPSGLVRQYSLCGTRRRAPRAYRVAVLHELDGRGGSQELHRDVRPGATLTVSAPRNRFPLVDAPSYLFLAGGIGITPLLAMSREVGRRGRPWRLVYGARSRSAMAFVPELRSAGGDVRLVAQDEDGLPAFDEEVAATAPDAAVYACGPAAMLDHLVDLRERSGWSQALHLERFAATAGSAVGDASAQDGAFEVELVRAGQRLSVAEGRSILDAVREVVPTVAFSCEEGYCGTCETVVLDGTPNHRDTYLTEDERRTGDTMMICVSRAASPCLRLDL